MTLKKNQHVVATAIDYTSDGMAICKVDGFPLFVNNMIIDEEAKLVVTKVNKKYGYAKVLEFITTSKHRQVPRCKVATQCGGCQLQHMDKEAQLQFKKQKVVNAISRIAKVDCEIYDCLGMDDPYCYRNKGQIPVGIKDDKALLGFYRIHSNNIVEMDYCHVQSPRINEVMQVMKQLLDKYQLATYFRHVLVKHSFESDEVMVVWIVNKRKFNYQQDMLNDLLKAIPQVKTVVLNLNERSDNVILGEEEWILYGDGTIIEQIADLKFKLSSKSFFQVNPQQTKVLYEKALEYAGLSGNELVIDLYCGVGSITLFLAKKASKVIGVEIVEQAIINAKENALLNKMDNVEFVCSDAASYASYLSEQNIKPDVIVVDPPRKGCDEITIASIIKMAPQRVVYVSCDPGTLARDIKRFDELGYKCEKIQPVDMFPHSFHTENVCCLAKK